MSMINFYFDGLQNSTIHNLINNFLDFAKLTNENIQAICNLHGYDCTPKSQSPKIDGSI
jgi:hypothetical protein